MPKSESRSSSGDMISLAGFAIDENVRFSIIEYKRDAADPYDLGFLKSERTRTIHTKTISLASGNRSAQISGLIVELLQESKDVFDLGKLKAIAVSCLGTIYERRALIDVSHSLPKSKWLEDGGKPIFVDFLKAAQEGVGKALKLSLMENFIAANDAKAGAEAVSFIQATGDDYVYLPIGQGVNAGIVIFNQLVLRDHHPEFGHFYPPAHPLDHPSALHSKGFPGTCAKHGTCLEGYLSIPAFLERRNYIPEWKGLTLSDIMKTDRAIDIASHYLAHLLYNTTLAFAPKKIIVSNELITKDILTLAVENMRGGLMRNPYAQEPLSGQYPAFPAFLEEKYVELVNTVQPIDIMTGALTLAYLLHHKHARLPRGDGELANDLSAHNNLNDQIQPTVGFLGDNVADIQEARKNRRLREDDRDQ